MTPEIKKIAKNLTDIACRQLWTSYEYKKPRMDVIDKYEAAYNGWVKQKMRITFNIPFPVLSGMVDTLLADFDDPISLQFKENDPADYNAIKKVSAAWQNQKDSLDSDLLWDMKLGWDRRQAIMTGRGILEYFVDKNPDFKQQFNTIKLKDFHFEPRGGGHLETHLFAGVSNFQRTEAQIEEAVSVGYYEKEWWDEMKKNHGNAEYKPDSSGSGGMAQYLGNFRSLGLDPETHNYIGESTYFLCKWVLTNKGKRYYLVFDPYTRTPLKLELLSEITESNLLPWTSWATHPDSENFLSKSYCDDFYPIHDVIGTLVSQELTNRAKQNTNARAYDPEMFPDVAKLDEASYRVDALVPATLSGARHISDGIYEFKTAELRGTIDMVNWLESALSKNTGVTEIQQAGAQRGKINVQYAMLQQAQKRISHKAQSFSQCYSEIGLRYLWGLKECMPSKMMVQMSGPDGYGWDELRRDEISFKKKPNVKIINQTEQDKMNVLGKDQKIQVMKEIKSNPEQLKHLNLKKVTEIELRDIGGWNDQDIFELLDTQNFASKDVMAEADKAIQELTKGRMPDLCYLANLAFLQKLLQFEKMHHNTLGEEKSMMFHEYIAKCSPIAMENMAALAAQLKLNGVAGSGAEGPGALGLSDGNIPEGVAPGVSGTPGPEMPMNRQNITNRVNPTSTPMAVGGGENV